MDRWGKRGRSPLNPPKGEVVRCLLFGVSFKSLRWLNGLSCYAGLMVRDEYASSESVMPI